jgi:hypothetical protein
MWCVHWWVQKASPRTHMSHTLCDKWSFFHPLLWFEFGNTLNVGQSLKTLEFPRINQTNHQFEVMGIDFSLLPCCGFYNSHTYSTSCPFVNKKDGCPIWWFVGFDVSYYEKFFKLNLKLFQLFMTHSIWGLGKKCHSLHHLDCMVNSSSWG